MIMLCDCHEACSFWDGVWCRGVDVNEVEVPSPRSWLFFYMRFLSLEGVTDCGSYPAPPPSKNEKKTRRHPRRRVCAIDSVTTCGCHFLWVGLVRGCKHRGKHGDGMLKRRIFSSWVHGLTRWFLISSECLKKVLIGIWVSLFCTSCTERVKLYHQVEILIKH